jgi:hypothetical protein
VAKALGEANLAAWSVRDVPDDVPLPDPGRVVLEQLRLASMRADLYGQMLRWQLDADDLGGLVGVTHGVSSDGQRHETGEKVRGLAILEAGERDRVVRFAKTAHDMGIADREIELQAGQASLVTTAFKAALVALGAALVPADRDLLTRTFLANLGRGPEALPAGDGS